MLNYEHSNIRLTSDEQSTQSSIVRMFDCSVVRLFCICFFFYQLPAAYCQLSRIDSLIALLKNDKADTNKVNHLSNLAWEIQFTNPDSSLLFSNYALELLSRTNNFPEPWKQYAIGKCYHQTAAFYNAKGNYLRAIDFYFKALAVWDQLEKTEKPDHQKKIMTCKSKTIGNLGVVYDEQGEYGKALDYYFKALKIDEALGRKSGIAAKFINIGLTCKEQADALPKTSPALQRRDSLYQKSLDYYFKAMKMNEELGNKKNVAICLGNIGAVYHEQQKPSEELDYYFRALKIDRELGDKNDIARWTQNIGSVYCQEKKYKEAEVYLLDALKMDQEVSALKNRMTTEIDLSNLYSAMGRYKESFGYYKQAMDLKDTLFSREKSKEITRKEMNYEFEKKEAAVAAAAEKQQAVAAAEKQRQRTVLLLVSCVLLLVLIFSGFIFRALRITHRQKHLIEEQKKMVEEKQKEILDSIHYAKRIQMALLPTDKQVDKTLKRLRKNN